MQKWALQYLRWKKSDKNDHFQALNDQGGSFNDI